jgi:hypothetical protein
VNDISAVPAASCFVKANNIECASAQSLSEGKPIGFIHTILIVQMPSNAIISKEGEDAT